MAIKLFELLGVITVNSSDANAQLDETAKKVAEFHKKFTEGIEKAASWGNSVVTTMGKAVKSYSKSINDIVTKTVTAGDQIDKASQRLNMTKQAYQEWKYVLGQCGMNIDMLEGGMVALTKKMKEAANPNSEAAKAMQQLGVAAYDSEGNLRNTSDVFKELVLAMTTVENESKKMELADLLFGGSGQKMLPLLNSTSEGIVQLIDRAHELGLIMSDEDVAASVKLNDTMDDVTQAFNTFSRDIGVLAMPALQEFYDFLLEIYPALKEEFEKLKPVISGLFEKLVDGFKWCIDNKDLVVTAIEAIAAVMLTMKVSKSALEFLNLLKGAKDIFGGGKSNTPNAPAPNTPEPSSNGGGLGESIGKGLGSGAAGKVAGKAIGKGAGTGTATATGTGTATATASSGAVGGGFLNFMSALTPLAVTAAAVLPAILEENRLTAERLEKNAENAAAANAVSAYGTNNPEILRLARITGEYWANEDKRSFADESEAIRKLFGYDDGSEGFDPAKIGRMNNALRMYGFQGNTFTGQNMDLVDVEMWLDSVGELLKQMQEDAKPAQEDTQVKTDLSAAVTYLQTIAANSNKPIVLNTGAMVGQLGSGLDRFLGQTVAMKARG